MKKKRNRNRVKQVIPQPNRAKILGKLKAPYRPNGIEAKLILASAELQNMIKFFKQGGKVTGFAQIFANHSYRHRVIIDLLHEQATELAELTRTWEDGSKDGSSTINSYVKAGE